MGHVGGHGEQGQVLPLAAGVIAVAAVAMVLVVNLGRAANERARARTAADAVALAGAAEGHEAAQRIAAANHAVIEAYTLTGDGVLVRVRVGSARATARAARTFESCPTAREPHPVHFGRCPPTAPARVRPRI
jgi:hypothetical protein